MEGLTVATRGWREDLMRMLCGRRLADCIDSRRDNILQLRLIAAWMVVVGHSFPLARPASWSDDPMRLLLPQTASHLVGLMVFFVISGLLITLSFQRQPNLLRFLRARFLRIWPAFALCVVLWGLVLGPLLSTLSSDDYFAGGNQHESPFAYAWTGIVVFARQSGLPGLFEANPIPKVINSPLWTIPVETSLYGCVAAAGVLRLMRFPWLTSVAVAIGFLAAFAWLLREPDFHYTTHLTFVVCGFFAVGFIACLLRQYVPISTGLMAVIAIACLLARGSAYESLFTWLAVGYFALWFSYVPRLPKIPFGVDLSYGIYLWAWPVQQSLVAWGIRDPWTLIFATTPILIGIATLSWLLIERPALRLKDVRWRTAPAAQPA